MDESVCTVEKQNGIAIMSLSFDSILWDDTEKVKNTFLSLINEGINSIVLDLTNTTYISSVVLASFVFMLKKAKDAGGNLILCGINPRVDEVLKMTNLDQVFEIVKDRQEAMGKLPQK